MKLSWPKADNVYLPQVGSTVQPFTVSKYGDISMKLSWKKSDPNTHLGMTNAVAMGCPAALWADYINKVQWKFENPQTVAIAGTNLRELTADWWGIVNGSLLCVKKGYRFNGASVPRALWFVVGHPFDPRHEAAALVHDILYGSGMLSRSEADWVLREMIENTRGKMQHMHAGVFWTCVRGFGWACGFGKSKKDAKFLEVWVPYGTKMEA